MKRLCLDCKRPYTPGNPSRCPACVQVATRARNRTKGAKYQTAEYRGTRAAWAGLIAAGERPACPRCGKGVGPDFDMGHQKDGSLRPEHPVCNRGNR